MTTPQEPTMTLSRYRREQDVDDNLFWRISCGDHQNLLDEALDRLDAAEELLFAAVQTAWTEEVKTALIWQALSVVRGQARRNADGEVVPVDPEIP